jgi:PadR family transcriptional regulator PadR
MPGFDPDLVRSSTETVILGVLAEGAKYGYEILALLRDRSEGRLALSAGTLYPILHKLEQQGAVSAQWREGTTRKRKYYALTNKGRRILRRRAGEWREFAGLVERFLRPALQTLQ